MISTKEKLEHLRGLYKQMKVTYAEVDLGDCFYKYKNGKFSKTPSHLRNEGDKK